MKCENCIAYGRDFISPLCTIGHCYHVTNIDFINNSYYGCRLHKKTIEQYVNKIKQDKSITRYKFYNEDWKEK